VDLDLCPFAGLTNALTLTSLDMIATNQAADNNGIDPAPELPDAGCGVGWAWRARAIAILVAFGATAPLESVGAILPARAAITCNPPTNPIVCENLRPGNPSSQWSIDGSGDPTIQGFATDISYDVGETAAFKIDTDAAAYTIDIYRMGYYQGNGARKVVSIRPSASLPQTQAACLTDSATLLYDCGNWSVSATWHIPATAVSGIYFAKLTRTDTGGASHIVFIVRDDASTSDLLFQTSDTTWQAYNFYGGNGLYANPNTGVKGTKVSYNRPFDTADTNANSWVFGSEYPMVRWLEANGYNVSYFTGIDSDRNGSLLAQHKVFLSVGHDEYWSDGQRANVLAARDAGVHLAFFSGNVSPWKTRWEPSIDATTTAYRTLVCYKETAAGHPIDPLDPPLWTGMWRDGRFSPPADGGRPENVVTGQLAAVGAGGNSFALQVPQADGQMRFWRNTAVANLSPGSVATISAGCDCIVGYEWDEDLDNGQRPAGLFHLSTTTESVSAVILDIFVGASIGPGTATHTLTIYKAASGVLVFDAGTINWSHGLDGNGYPHSTPDLNVQQATVNVLADMGVQPGSLQSGLVPATASTDTTPPTSQVVSPTSGSSLLVGFPATVSGTAADFGGGVVGGVDVSFDGGGSWHPAVGRASWSYIWVPQTEGPATIVSRAVDDSGNVETPGAGVTVVVVTATSSPTPSPSLTSTETNTPTSTSTPTITPSPTISLSSTSTGSSTETPTSTLTQAPAQTTTPVSTPTPSPTRTIAIVDPSSVVPRAFLPAVPNILSSGW
jgi:hypothetical protein